MSSFGDIILPSGKVLQNPDASVKRTKNSNSNAVPIQLTDQQKYLSYAQWTLYREKKNHYTLYLNPFRTVEFILYADKDPTKAKKLFVQYCDLVSYADNMCICLSPSDGYDSSYCLKKLGYNPKKLTPYQYSQMAKACGCFLPECSNIIGRKKGSKFFHSCSMKLCGEDVDITADSDVKTNTGVKACFSGNGGYEGDEGDGEPPTSILTDTSPGSTNTTQKVIGISLSIFGSLLSCSMTLLILFLLVRVARRR